MSLTCEACGYDNPNDIEFCSACGAELTQVIEKLDLVSSVEPSFTPASGELEPPSLVKDPEAVTSSSSSIPIVGSAKLISKIPNAPVSEFILDSSSCLIGRFDPDSGPVEVDLEGFPGDDTISRHHAEIYYEAGEWKIKDLGSTNGVFIKRAQETRYAARITSPQSLYTGDEVAIAKIRFLFQVD